MLSLQMLLSKCGRRRGDEMELLLVIYFSATKAEQIMIFFYYPFIQLFIIFSIVLITLLNVSFCTFY